MTNRVIISSGHGKYVGGASGVLNEVDEARVMVEMLAEELRHCGVDVVTYHDDVSVSQNENLNRIVDFHNSKARDLDVSVHLNAHVETDKPMGCEVLYASQETAARRVSAAIAAVGFIDRGAKYRTDLFFLNKTSAPAILLEICFVDSEADAEIYRNTQQEICENIASLVSGEEEIIDVPDEALLHVVGPASYFGGPEDDGVDADEGLAFIESVEDAPYLFLPTQPEGTTGLARRLNPYVPYVACRWDYGATPKTDLLEARALVRAVHSGVAMLAFPADWGPHEDTGRVADLSPGLMESLRLETDDEVEVIFPYREEDGS